MNLFTPVPLPTGLPRLRHGQPLLLLGSCFTTNIGLRLQAGKFQADVNPFGVLYNPLSIATALERIAEGSEYAKEELFFHREEWHSPMHHSDFSAATAEETLERINRRLRTAHEALPQTEALLLTWGTAYVYETRETGQVVGNCHKLPERCFVRRRLTVEEVTERYKTLLEMLHAVNPQMKVVLTVSPIRHLRDGLHENQLSKATLLLATDRLQVLFPESVSYFPAYEIMIDELRDYRFYADDLVHPSTVAVQHVWERFAEACFTEETRQVAERCEEIGKALQHKPFRPDSEAYKSFLEQIVLKIDRLCGKYPYLDFQNDRELCLTRLKTSVKS